MKKLLTELLSIEMERGGFIGYHLEQGAKTLQLEKGIAVFTVDPFKRCSCCILYALNGDALTCYSLRDLMIAWRKWN